MCGIAGLWDPTVTSELLLSLADSMTQALHHRGPDGFDTWSDAPVGLALGHRRLAVQDLSVEGRQPMVSESGRYVISYNGEIYNAADLREQLNRDPASFRGHSDTEVALALIESLGLRGAIEHFNGMFAFALWDRQERELSLARDRVGIKPLFWGRAGRALLFGSQSSALRQHPRFDKAVSPEAVTAYIRSNYVPAPLCIHRDAWKVMPGTILRFTSSEGSPAVQTYWDARQVAIEGQRNPRSDHRPQELVEELDALLTDSVKRRMIADVPLGAFLSGGIDSSTVVALMSKLSDRPIKTFTIGTREASHDESDDARAIAKHLGTDHHEFIVTAEDAREVAGRICDYYDEPFADSSQIPTFLVSRMAREHVTVSLSGDGGDELFGGYNRHLWAPRVARLNRALPPRLRRHLGWGVSRIRPSTLEWAYRKLVPKIGSLNVRLPADKAIKLGRAISSASDEHMYDVLAHSDADPKRILSAGFYTSQAPQSLVCLPDLAHKFMFQDMIGYLADDILTKIDRASMAVSLEARVPILDHRVVEFAWSLPLTVKLRAGQGKWILRQVLAKYVPAHLVARPKSGFGIPIERWLNQPSWQTQRAKPTKAAPLRPSAPMTDWPNLVLQDWCSALARE